MHLVKWFRKNMQKVMVFVVITIMAAFVLGQGLKYLVDSMFNTNKRVIATYSDGEKIKVSDARIARSELDVLRMLMADRLLMGQRSGGISGPLLTHLLFPDSQISAQIASQMKQAIQQGQLKISQDELDSFFNQRSEQPEVLWLLLKNEAYQAGCAMSDDMAKSTLRNVIPQITGNQIDAAGVVNGIITQNNISEEQIVRIFSDLLTIMAYSQQVMDNQAVTINQIKASLGRSKERIDAEFVKIDAAPLIDDSTDITDAQAQQQFDTYKAVAPNNPTDENPFGFGYRLGKRVQLEYMIVLMDDVTKQIEKPTAEAAEEYYSRNIDRFKTSKPSDPNDPESAPVTETRSFAEAEVEIRQTLESEKTLIQANILFNEIKDKTEAGFESLNFDESSMTELQSASGDFVAVGSALAAKNNIPIATGKTGWLDAAALGSDDVLSRMSLRRGQDFLRLSDLAFAATEEKSQRQRIGMPSIRVWETIGPLSGGYYSEEESKFYRLMALVRVVGIKESAAASDINLTFDTRGANLAISAAPEDASFSLIEQVKDDIRLLAAMDAAKARANELAAIVSEKNWEDAVTAYNDKYAADEDAQDSQAIEMGSIQQQLRTSQADIEMARRIMLANPSAASYIQQQLETNLLTDKLYALLPEDAETTGTTQTVMTFEPQAACYVVKEVVRQPATVKDYLDSKAQTALQLNALDSAGLALTHFGPENILERMDYQLKDKPEPVEEDAASVSSDEESE